MGKRYFEIHPGRTGELIDGRKFEIVDFRSMMVCTDGSVTYADVTIKIDGEFRVIRVSELCENISSIENFKMREKTAERKPVKIQFNYHARGFYCPKCNTGVSANTDRCPHCNVRLLPAYDF